MSWVKDVKKVLRDAYNTSFILLFIISQSEKLSIQIIGIIVIALYLIVFFFN